MGEELKFSDYDADDHVSEWEVGLPTSDDLTPLSQSLIPPELASAFSISPEPYRTILDVNRASHITFSSLGGQYCKYFNSIDDEKFKIVDVDEINLFDSRKLRRIDVEEGDSGGAGTMTKRHRLVWTPQLHKRFVDVVAHLGIKNAVPKTIMQLMNVEGLTRENVASHLQKYRLYLKRMQQGLDSGPSASDHLFASTPVPSSLNEGNGSGNVSVPVPMVYGAGSQMVPMPSVYGHMGGGYPGFEYSIMQQRDWPGNNKFGAVNSYQRITPTDK